MSERVIRVAPLGWKEGPYEPEKVFLSDMDHTMPRIYVLIAEVFEFPEYIRKENVIRDLSKGLEHALSQFPPLAGSLHMDESDGRLCKRNTKKAYPPLYS